MQWSGVDVDGYESALLALARQEHRGDPVGGQPLPPMVPPVCHAGAVEGPDWDAQTHCTVQPGSIAEETAIGSGGGEGGHRQGFQRLWAPPGDGDLLQITGTVDLGRVQRLAGGGEKLVPGK